MANKQVEATIINRTIETLTSNATSVRPYCFYNCTSLATVSLPNCEILDTYSFYGCSAITSLSLPSCKYIKENALDGINTITELSLPECLEIKALGITSTSITTISLPKCQKIGVQGLTTKATSIILPECLELSSQALGSTVIPVSNISIPKIDKLGTFIFTSLASTSTLSLVDARTATKIAFPTTGANTTLYVGVQLQSVSMTSRIATQNYKFEHSENDNVLFSFSNFPIQGNNKTSITYNIYTDNTIIKSGFESKANQYTTINVYKKDGSSW